MTARAMRVLAAGGASLMIALGGIGAGTAVANRDHGGHHHHGEHHHHHGGHHHGGNHP